MAKDFAQRQFDVAGYRISNLGTPAEAGDATKTDNTIVPLAGRRNGSPGTSLVAAASDHIHPLEPDVFTFSDPDLQIVDVRREVWFGVIDFDQLVGDQVQVGLASLLENCLLMAWLDGEVGNPSAGTLVMNIDSSATSLVPIASVGSAPFPRPAGSHLMTLTAQQLATSAQGKTQGRVVTLRGLF